MDTLEVIVLIPRVVMIDDQLQAWIPFVNSYVLFDWFIKVNNTSELATN